MLREKLTLKGGFFVNRHTFSSIITLIIIFIIEFNFNLSPFWDLTYFYYSYFIFSVLCGLYLSEFSNQEFEEALVACGLRIVFLTIFGFVVSRVTGTSSFLLSLIVLGITLFMQKLFSQIILSRI